MIDRDQVLSVRAESEAKAAAFFAENYGVPTEVRPQRATAVDPYGFAIWTVPAAAAKPTRSDAAASG